MKTKKKKWRKPNHTRSGNTRKLVKKIMSVGMKKTNCKVQLVECTELDGFLRILYPVLKTCFSP